MKSILVYILSGFLSGPLAWSMSSIEPDQGEASPAEVAREGVSPKAVSFWSRILACSVEKDQSQRESCREASSSSDQFVKKAELLSGGIGGGF